MVSGKSGERSVSQPVVEGTGMLVCLAFFTVHACVLYIMLNEAIWAGEMGKNDHDLSWGARSEEG